PLPVLGFCVWVGLSVPMMLLSAVAGHRVVPFFGMFLTEWSASIFCVIFAAVWGYAAWSLYKLRLSGWWVTLIAFCVLLVSGLVTFSRHNIPEMYRFMQYPEAQVHQIEQLGVFNGNNMMYVMLFCMAPFFGYLLFIRKFIV